MYKLDTQISGESHTRTVVKAVCYRIMSICITIALTFVLGGTMLQAISMGGIVLAIGSIHYYLYDRLWLWIPWHRDQLGKDTMTRSVVKSVIYRITALIITALMAKLVFADSNLIAFLLATLKFVANAIGYFVIERIFNVIDWGRKKTTRSPK